MELPHLLGQDCPNLISKYPAQRATTLKATWFNDFSEAGSIPHQRQQTRFPQSANRIRDSRRCAGGNASPRLTAASS